MIKVLLIILVLTTTTQAQSLKASLDRATTEPLSHRTAFLDRRAAAYTGVGICAAGVVADIASSIGGREGNPLLRSRDGTFNVRRAIVIEAAPCVSAAFFAKKRPRFVFWLGTAIGAVHLVAAIHNSRVPKR